MSPLIHKSMTWATVGTVVLLSGWLASSAQTARDMGGFPLRLAQKPTTHAVKSAPRTAPAPLSPPTAQVQVQVQVASTKR